MISKLRTGSAFVALVSIAALASACASKNSGGGGPTTNEQLASAGQDDQNVQSSLESMGSSFVGSSNGSLALYSERELNAPAGSLGSLHELDTWSNPAGGFYQPAGCLTANSDPATKTVVYSFNDCTGPFGLVHLTGDVTVVWSSSGPTNLQLQFSAMNFKINKATVSTWSATATITANGNDRDMQWTAQLQGTTGSGRQFDRTNNKDIKWTVGTPCIAISGTSQGNITGLNLLTTISNYQQCADSCPAANSEINIKDVDNGESIDIKYLGGPHAQFTSVNGTVTDLPLACGL